MELEILKFLQSIRSEWLNFVFETITTLGEQNFYIFLVSLILWCYDKKTGYRVAFIMLVSGAINTGIKDIIQRPRPIGSPGLTSIRVHTATGYSFPSNHTQTATSAYTTLAINFKKKWLYVLSFFAVFFIGISRNYLAVHWPTDVAAGWILGIVISLSANYFLQKIEEQKKYALSLLFFPIFLIALPFSKDVSFLKFFGTFTGLILGYLLDNYYFMFQIPEKPLRKIGRLLIGLAGAALIMVGYQSLIPGYKDIPGLVFFKYQLLGLWLTIGAPIFFQKTNQPNE